MVNLRNALMTGGGWKNPYVTDGLVAMWDGEWNAGGGVHSNERILTNIISGIRTSLPDVGYTVSGNSIISAAGYSFYFDDTLPISGATKFTIESVGCCESRPTTTLNVSGAFSVRGAGGVFMWRRTVSGEASGVVGGIVWQQSDGKIHYYGAPSSQVVANQEADAEVFGVLYSRSIVFSTTGGGPLLYRDGQSKDGSNTMNYTDNIPSTNLYKAGSPSASSCAIRWTNLRVYIRQLSAAEVAANYAIDKARFNMP